MLAGGMILAGVLIVIMSGYSRLDAHPDEIWHVNAAKYYVKHWAPPRVCDARALDSYSQYGMSYLNRLEPVYFLAGKFAALIGYFRTSDRYLYLYIRTFNVLMFFLLLYLVARRDTGVIFLPLLLTPQVWYIFSYFNGDAFPFFLTFLAADQILREDSRFNRFLRQPRENWPGGVWCGVLVGLLAVSKMNYLEYLVFLGGFVLLELALKKRGREYLSRILVVVVIAGSIFLVQTGVDRLWHGSEKGLRIEECAEKTAQPGFRPSDHMSGKGFAWSHLRSKGVRYRDLFVKARWGEMSFMSFVGVYGYMVYYGPAGYYLIMVVLHLALGLVLAVMAVQSRDADTISLLLLVVAMAVLSVLISSYHSWVSDFQAQGRYLFPLLPMLAFLLHRIFNQGARAAVAMVSFSIFALSVYSFAGVGLVKVQALM